MMKQMLRKESRRILSALIITVVMAASLVVFGAACPEKVYAAGTNDIKAGDHITMGNDSAAGYDGTPYWRVLDKRADGSLLLMSEYLWNGNSRIGQYGKIPFRVKDSGNAWQGSNAQKWCEDFYETVLKDTEGLNVCATTQTDKAWTSVVTNTSTTYVAIDFLGSENILNNDKVFFLSMEEIEKYMPEMQDRIAYGKDVDTSEMAAQLWWSRSPEKTTSDTGRLINVGNILKNGKVNKTREYSECYARPAFYAELSPDLCLTGTANGNTTDWTVAAQKHELVEANYTWSEDNRKCMASAVCSVCGDTISESVDATEEVTEEPTIEKEGTKILTAVFNVTGFETQTKTVPVPRLEPTEGDNDSGSGNDSGNGNNSKEQTAPANTTKTYKATPVTINVRTVSASAVKKAVKKAEKKGQKPSQFVLGKNVRTIKKGAFKGTSVKTITVKSKKLSRKSVKGSLKGSKVNTIKVKVGKKATNKKYVRKYKKIFTKKNAGKKVKVR